MQARQCIVATGIAVALAQLLGCGSGSTTPAAEASSGAEQHHATTAEALEAAIVGSHRKAKDIARNRYRHPVQTLTFLGLEKHMSVVELWPGGGWYTGVLAPVLRDEGKLILAGPDTALKKRGAGMRKLMARLHEHPRLYGTPTAAVLEPPEHVTLAEPGSVDMVLTFRNLHNWMMADGLKEVFVAAYEALKPGGVFGVIEHRGVDQTDPKTVAKTGYMPQAYVIELAESVGFKLAEQSEVNANAADTKDHPGGVWSLPPVLKLGDQDRDKYLAIGESDRMTLKFVK